MPDKFGSRMFYSITLHPHSRENGASGNDGNVEVSLGEDEVGWAKR